MQNKNNINKLITKPNTSPSQSPYKKNQGNNATPNDVNTNLNAGVPDQPKKKTRQKQEIRKKSKASTEDEGERGKGERKKDAIFSYQSNSKFDTVARWVYFRISISTIKKNTLYRTCTHQQPSSPALPLAHPLLFLQPTAPLHPHHFLSLRYASSLSTTSGSAF